MAQYEKLINLGLLSQFLTKAKTIFAPKITASGILKGDGAGNVSAATAGTDYATPAQSLALGLTGAFVGDLVRVNSVDATGKPTSWKHVPLNEIKCNKNLFDNWYFANPVNQRGQTIYNVTNSRGITIDRWFGYDGRQSGTVEVTSDGVTVTKTSDGDGIYFGQILEQDLTGKTATLTVLTSTGTLFTGSVVIANNAVFISAWPNINGKATIENGHTVIQVYVYAASLTIKAVKLELGAEQTLAHNEGTEENPIWVLNEIPDYGEELRKCQRYYCRIPQYINFLKVYEEAAFTDIIVNVPVPMRGYPSTAGLISGLTINTCISDPLNTTALRFRLNGTTTDPMPYAITTLEISADL